MVVYAALMDYYAALGWGKFGYYTFFLTLVLDLPALAAFGIGMVETPGTASLLLVANRVVVLSANGGNSMLVSFHPGFLSSCGHYFCSIFYFKVL